jgi:hypothetical protein
VITVVTPPTVEVKVTAPKGVIPVFGVMATLKVRVLSTVAVPEALSTNDGVPLVIVRVPLPEAAL